MKKAERVFGLHAVTSLLQRNPTRVVRLLVLESRADARINTILSLADTANVPVRRAGRHELDELVKGASHQGVVAETG
ncbi:MAG TPA: 23S rRNA (guanosine(2251)-2'-O)-methyltransferase RlmB, partial [Gammaproteobacteria bacterium]|nr:23S rRNA (guanosine(2251)-2'-O)-methyltransferase RlmB [Gammaproteobacteria bacterium]